MRSHQVPSQRARGRPANGSHTGLVALLLPHRDRYNTSSAASAAGGPMPPVALSSSATVAPKRQSAAQFLARQRATPVRLGHHPTLDALVPDGGLRSGEMLLMCCPATNMPSAANSSSNQHVTTEIAYHIAAEHAGAAGGRVMWVSAPGGRGGMRHRRMALHLEEAVRGCSLQRGGADSLNEVASAIGNAATLIESLSCSAVDVLLSTLLSLGSSNTNDDAKDQQRCQTAATGRKRDRGDGADAVVAVDKSPEASVTPLLIIDGIGATQYLGLYERVLGQGEVPLRQALHRAVAQLHCAVIILDAGYAPPTPSTFAASTGGPTDDAVITAVRSCYAYKYLVGHSTSVSSHTASASHFQPYVHVPPTQSTGYSTASSCSKHNIAALCGSSSEPAATARHNTNHALQLKAAFYVESFLKPAAAAAVDRSVSTLCARLEEYAMVSLCLHGPGKAHTGSSTDAAAATSELRGGSATNGQLAKKAMVAFRVDVTTCVTAA